MAEKDKNSPATTSLAYDVMAPKWDKINTLLGGTEAMRAAGRAYLPQHPEESNQAYSERLQVTTLLNMVDMTLTALVSKPFSSPVNIGEDVPEQIENLLDDVDQQGTSLNRFARAWFREGVAMGYSAVMVDFPKVEDPAPGVTRTLDDDRKENLRPYLIRISPENLISADYEIINGKEQLTQVRILEHVVKSEGFAQKVVEQIRVVYPGRGEIWQKTEVKKGGKTTWRKVSDYTYDLPYIPIHIFYADRQGFMLSKPPLLDLANLNIRHWQSTSDQIAILTVARFPMLAVTGSTDSSDLVVGPNSLLSAPDSAGRFYYVEHTGKAIAAGRQDTQDLEEQMAEYGATFLKRRPGGETATGRALDSAEVTSALQDMSLGFQDSLREVMRMFGEWLRISEPGTFSVQTDFSLTDSQEATLVSLREARDRGDLSRRKYLTRLIEVGVLSDTFSLDENEEELKTEPKSESPMKPEPAVTAGGIVEDDEGGG